MDDKIILDKAKQIISDIKASIKQINKTKQGLKKNYDLGIRNLDLQLKAVQNKCPHWDTIYHPDPSGNSDSWHECVDCGKDV